VWFHLFIILYIFSNNQKHQQQDIIFLLPFTTCLNPLLEVYRITLSFFRMRICFCLLHHEETLLFLKKRRRVDILLVLGDLTDMNYYIVSYVVTNVLNNSTLLFSLYANVTCRVSCSYTNSVYTIVFLISMQKVLSSF